MMDVELVRDWCGIVQRNDGAWHSDEEVNNYTAEAMLVAGLLLVVFACGVFIHKLRDSEDTTTITIEQRR